MRAMPWSRRALAVLVAGTSCACFAQGLDFYRNLPASNMNEEDHRIARGAIANALDNGNDGTAYRWSNQATGAAGSVMPKKSFKRNGMACRSAEFFVSAGGRENVSTWNLCKTAEGWKVVD
jgi:surface antigen